MGLFMSIQSQGYSYKKYHMSTTKDYINAKEGFRKNPVHAHLLKVHPSDPFERGKIHGQVMQSQIETIYSKGELMLNELGSEIVEQVTILGESILQHSSKKLQTEMEGIAEGADVPLKTVRLMNALPAVLSNQMACNSVATKKNKQEITAVVSENMSANKEVETRPLQYATKMKRKVLKGKSIHNTLNSVSNFSTIRTKVFHPAQRSVDVAMSTRYAPGGSFYRFTSEILFEETEKAPTTVQVENESAKETYSMGHNLDFSGWGEGGEDYPFAQNQLILVREEESGMKTASFTFPGLVGMTEGMNSDGVSMSVLSHLYSEAKVHPQGEHIHFTFYDALSTSRSAKEFLGHVEQRTVASAIHLTGCDSTTAFSLEFSKHNQADNPGWDYAEIKD